MRIRICIRIATEVAKLLCIFQTDWFSSMCSRRQNYHHFILFPNTWKCPSFQLHQETSTSAALMNRWVQGVRLRSVISRKCAMIWIPQYGRNLKTKGYDNLNKMMHTCISVIHVLIKVMIIRNYHHKGCSLLSDPTQLKGWSEVFDTDKKEDVEEECRKTYQDFTWKKNGSLRLINKHAFENHPVTGDRVWFNSALVSIFILCI